MGRSENTNNKAIRSYGRIDFDMRGKKRNIKKEINIFLNG